MIKNLDVEDQGKCMVQFWA